MFRKALAAGFFAATTLAFVATVAYAGTIIVTTSTYATVDGDKVAYGSSHTTTWSPLAPPARVPRIGEGRATGTLPSSAPGQLTGTPPAR